MKKAFIYTLTVAFCIVMTFSLVACEPDDSPQKIASSAKWNLVIENTINELSKNNANCKVSTTNIVENLSLDEVNITSSYYILDENKSQYRLLYGENENNPAPTIYSFRYYLLEGEQLYYYSPQDEVWSRTMHATFSGTLGEYIFSYITMLSFINKMKDGFSEATLQTDGRYSLEINSKTHFITFKDNKISKVESMAVEEYMFIHDGPTYLVRLSFYHVFVYGGQTVTLPQLD